MMRALALAGVHLVIWAGGPAPLHPAAGLELTPNGQVRTPSGTLHLSSAAVARLRRAAVRFLAQRPRSVHGAEVDGSYVAAFVQDGARKGGAADTGTISPAMAQLLDALPKTTAVRAKAPKDRPVPANAPCDIGRDPTDIVQEVPLQVAYDRGLAQLKTKGPISGDSVAVDAHWKRLTDLPVGVTVHLELVHQPGDAKSYVNDVKAALDRAYANSETDDGQKMVFTFDVTERAFSAAPRKCFHEVVMHSKADVISEMSALGPKQLTGDWEGKEPWTWKHEVGHALGIDDRYKIVHDRSGKEHAVSVNTTPDDFMGATKGGHLLPSDATTIAEKARLVIYADPGEILVNGDSSAQNFVIGAPFELSVPTNGTAHVDGMVGYCIDSLRRIPDRGMPLAVSGRAGDLGGAALAALQRVVDVVAAREPGPLEETPGANAAIWRVTDDEPTDDPDALSILDAAGIPADAVYNAPHFGGPPVASAASLPRASIHGDTVRVGSRVVWRGDGEWEPEQALAGAGGRVAIVARRDGSGNGAWELLLGRPLHRALSLPLGDTHDGELTLDGVDRTGRHVRVTRVLDDRSKHLTFSL